MILFNLTVNIEKESHDEWMKWMVEIFIPSMKSTGLFVDTKRMKLLTEVDNNPGFTYSFQFFSKNMEAMKKFQDDFEYNILSSLYRKFQNRFVEFRTVLEVLE